MRVSRSFRSYATRNRSMRARSSSRGTDARGWTGWTGTDRLTAGAVARALASVAEKGIASAIPVMTAVDEGGGKVTMDDGEAGSAVGAAGGRPESGETGACAGAGGEATTDDTEPAEAGSTSEDGVHPGGRGGIPSAVVGATVEGTNALTIRRRSRTDGVSSGSDGSGSGPRRTSLIQWGRGAVSGKVAGGVGLRGSRSLGAGGSGACGSGGGVGRESAHRNTARLAAAMPTGTQRHRAGLNRCRTSSSCGAGTGLSADAFASCASYVRRRTGSFSVW